MQDTRHDYRYDYTAYFKIGVTHVVHGTGEVEAQVGRSEADNGQLADAAVLELRLSQEVEGDEAREPDGVESDVACLIPNEKHVGENQRKHFNNSRGCFRAVLCLHNRS